MTGGRLVAGIFSVLLLVLGGVMVALFVDSLRSGERFNHPEYKYLTGLLEKNPADGRPYYIPTTVSLRRINAGDWQFICLVGGYSEPKTILQAEAAMRGVSIISMEEAYAPILASSTVEEYEGAIGLVDRSGRGRVFMIPSGYMLAYESQHFRRCFGPGTDEIVLPIDNLGPDG